MHRYEELEKIYYRKKYLKIFKNMLFFILIVLIGGYIYFSQKHTNNQVTNIENNKTTEKNVIKEINKTENNITTEMKDNNSTKEDNTTFVDKNNTLSKTIDKIEINKTKTFQPIKKLTLYPIFPDITNVKPEKKSVKPKKTIKHTKPKKEINTTKPEIKIIIKTEKQTIDSLIKLYNIEPTYDKAMKIAYLYYDKQDYENTIKWLKIANRIDPENDESWYLFAKSLLQLGNRKKAKEVLIVYLNTYGTSEKIEKLLRSIK